MDRRISRITAITNRVIHIFENRDTGDLPIGWKSELDYCIANALTNYRLELLKEWRASATVFRKDLMKEFRKARKVGR